MSYNLGISYYLNGAVFQNSAKELSKTIELDNEGRPTKLTAIPFYFLTSHAAELFLKAALLKRGFAENDLKKHRYRHDLNSLLLELKNKGVVVSENTSKTINSLHKQHKDHHLKYNAFVDFGKSVCFLPLESVLLMLDELLMLTRISTQGV